MGGEREGKEKKKKKENKLLLKFTKNYTRERKSKARQVDNAIEQGA